MFVGRLALGRKTTRCPSKLTSLYEHEIFKHEVIPLDTWIEYYEYLQLVYAKVQLINKEFQARSAEIDLTYKRMAEKYKKVYQTANENPAKIKRRDLRKAAAIAYAVSSKEGIL